MKTIAIIGGGVAGSSTALALAKKGLDVTLFEKESSLISGPPFCHLHAGGNLYREISDEQCLTLLKQSILFARTYPYCVDYRPTVIAVPKRDKGSVEALLPRLKRLQLYYQALVEESDENQCLGKPEQYYTLYSQEKIEALKKEPIPSSPSSCDEWMISVAHNIDTTKVQFPLILVQEYGLNLFQLSAGLSLELDAMENVSLQYECEVHHIQKDSLGWELFYKNKEGVSHSKKFDYLINATGFQTGRIDEMVQAPCCSMVEFKAAYVTHWESSTSFPEIVFHGERGTPQGMTQFTPYPQGYFQLHGMTKEITLYEDGLMKPQKRRCQAILPSHFQRKLKEGWEREELHQRTQNAINYLSYFIPSFASASVGGKPLYGAQQIPGDDPTLRVAEVSFPLPYYARCEIVKVSSVSDMICSIEASIFQEEKKPYKVVPSSIKISEKKRVALAKEIAKRRHYPEAMAEVCFTKPSL